MLNWNTDEVEFKKRDPKAYKLWRMVQLINYGLDGEKLNAQEVKDAWPDIRDRINPDRQKVIEFYLWGKKWQSDPGLLFDRSNFWSWYFRKKTSSIAST